MPTPLISCLCVTRHRVPLLQRAVACFHAQTYAPRELIVVYEADDLDTGAYLRTVADPRVRSFAVPSERKRPLGELRNYAVQVSRGAYVCQWDDDDWCRDDRLAVQLQALLASGKAACVLSRWLCLDALTQTAYLSRARTWEGSLLCRTAALPPYPHVPRGEDTDVVQQLLRTQQLLQLDQPELYVYTFHGGNTWDRTHWRGVLLGAQRLGEAETRQLIAASHSASIAPLPAAPSDYLAETRRVFDEACARRPAGLREARYRFAGLPVRLRVVGPRLATHIHAAFEPLHCDDAIAAPAALTIDLWDRAYSGLGCPGVPFSPDTTTALDDGLLTVFGDGEVLRYERPRSVTCLDHRAGRLLGCWPAGDPLALHERSKPFPLLLAAWYQRQGVLPLHAGLVARDGRGVLFVGASGAGKTTCALACALADFDYLGDDAVGLQRGPDGTWWGHSCYAAARLDSGHLLRFPSLRPHAIASPFDWEPKSLVLMPRVVPGRLAARARVVAAVMPRLSGQGVTRLTPASPVETLITLAATTLRQPLSPALPGWHTLGDLLESLPCYRLDIGSDVAAIPPLVDQLLAAAPR